MLKLKDRIRARYSVSVCEVGDGDLHQLGVLGVACVDRDAEQCRTVLQMVRGLVEGEGDCWLTEANGEVFALGKVGANLRGGIESLRGGIFDDTSGPDHTTSSSREPTALDGVPSSGDIRAVSGRTKRLQVKRRSNTQPEKK